jgi:hypothetical protein
LYILQFWILIRILDAVSIPGGHAASICDNTSEAICRVLEEEEESAIEIHEFEVEREFLY